MVRMHDYERRSSLLSIDVQFPELDVAGSIPVYRSFVFNTLAHSRRPLTPQRSLLTG